MQNIPTDQGLPGFQPGKRSTRSKLKTTMLQMGCDTQAEMNCADKVLIFLHIPKSGGTTLNSILAQNFPSKRTFTMDSRDPLVSIRSLKSMAPSQRDTIDLISGHCPFGVHELLSRQAAYITMLRNPVDRICSWYYYVLRSKANFLHKRVTSENLSLDQFVRQRELTAGLNNGQTRWLAGWDAYEAPYGACGRDVLETAKENLRRYFAVAGVTERFEESLLLMQRMFRWPYVLYRKKNVTPDRPSSAQIAPDTLDAIRKNNDLDLELYDWVHGGLCSFIHHKSGVNSKIAVGLLRITNACYNRAPRLRKYLSLFQRMAIRYTT